MNQTPAKDLNESNLFQNTSCVTLESHGRTEQNFQASKVRLPLSTIKLVSNHQDFSKNKIMQLQQELLKLRKEISQKECLFSRQKSTLLSKIQILTEENTEMKHRQQSLVQLNHTLQLAIKTKDNSARVPSKKQAEQIENMKSEVEAKSKMIKELRRSLDQSKRILRNMEDEKYKIIQEKERKINQLSVTNKKLESEREAQVGKIKMLLNSRLGNKEIVNAIYKALNIHISKDMSFDDLQAESNYFDESPIIKRNVQVNNRIGGRSSGILDTSHSQISSRSFIHDLNSHKNIPSECSQDYNEQEMLLCQVCKKVFEEDQFISHMRQCNELSQLQRQRQNLERAIYNINQQQRTSVSQKRSRIENMNRRESDQQAYQTERSISKVQKRKSQYEDWDKGKKIVVQLHTPKENHPTYKTNKNYY